MSRKFKIITMILPLLVMRLNLICERIISSL
nr:MAG TPA: hypothetical protein [Inoviridae sp.]